MKPFTKRLLSLLLTVVMLVGILPMSAFAVADKSATTEPVTVEEGSNFSRRWQFQYNLYCPCCESNTAHYNPYRLQEFEYEFAVEPAGAVTDLKMEKSGTSYDTVWFYVTGKGVIPGKATITAKLTNCYFEAGGIYTSYNCGWYRVTPEASDFPMNITLTVPVVVAENPDKETTYALTYNANAGTDTVNGMPAPNPDSFTGKVDSHEFTVSNAEPKRDGYTFKGWADTAGATVAGYRAGDKIDLKKAAPTKTIYAVWEKVPTYTVTYTDGVDGEEIFADQVYTVKAGQSTPAFEGTPAREGYKFMGWKPEVAETVSDNVTYVAQWNKLYNYTLNYYDGTNKLQTEEIGPTTETSHEFTVIANPEKEGYIFQGWADEPNGEPKYGAGSKITVDSENPGKDVYAVWQEIEKNTYTLTYIANAGDGAEVKGMPENLEVKDPADSHIFTLTGTPTRDGYTFKGWGEMATSLTPIETPEGADGPQVTATKENPSVIVYAIWEKNPPAEYTYTLTYDANKPAEAPATSDVKDMPKNVTVTTTDENCTFQLTTDEPSLYDYEFKGWAASDDGKDPITEITATKDNLNVTVYAIWAKKAAHEHSYTWTEDSDGTHTGVCECGDTINEPHTWDEGVVTTEPNCGNTGVKTYTCTKCGATKTEELPKVGEHNWEKVATGYKAPTFTEEGYQDYVCTVCGEKKTEVLPKLVPTLPTLGDLVNILGEMKINLVCTVDGSHSKTADLVETSVGPAKDLQQDEDGNWVTSTTLYVDQYAEQCEKLGHKLVGTQENATIPLVFQVSADGETGEWKVAVESVDILMYCETVYRTVTFDVNGGSPEIEAQTVEDGEKIAKPEDPTRNGYVFDGWYNGEELYDFDAPVTEDITLTAKWSKICSVHVVIYRNGDTSKAYKDVALAPMKAGETLDVSTLNIADYYSKDSAFEGWYNDGGWNAYKIGNPNNTISKPITINGWTNIICMVTDYEAVNVKAVYNGDKEGAQNIFTGKALHGANLMEFLEANVTGLEKTGYTLDKWYNWDWYGHKIDDAKTVSGWTNVYVTYTANEYNVSFDAGEGNTVEPAGKTVTFNSAYGELPVPVHANANYVFAGWTLNGETVTAETVVTTAEDHTLVAKWDLPRPAYPRDGHNISDNLYIVQCTTNEKHRCEDNAFIEVNTSRPTNNDLAFNEETGRWEITVKIALERFVNNTVSMNRDFGGRKHYMPDGQSIAANRRPEIKLYWDPTAEGTTSLGEPVVGLWKAVDGNPVTLNVMCYEKPAAPKSAANVATSLSSKMLWLRDSANTSNSWKPTSKEIKVSPYAEALSFGEVYTEGGKFYCDVTVDPAPYIEYFNNKYPHDCPYVIDTEKNAYDQYVFTFVYNKGKASSDYAQDGTGWSLDTSKTAYDSSSAKTEKLNGKQVWLKQDHKLTYAAATDPTCVENGNVEYWYCSACDKYYSDEACTKEIAKDAIVIPAPGHKDEDNNGFCDVCNVCLHEKDEDGYCTVMGCEHDNTCCPKPQVTVTFDVNGGVMEGETSKTVDYGRTYGELPKPTRINYTFMGWTTEDGRTVTSDSLVTIKENHTLTAAWSVTEPIAPGSSTTNASKTLFTIQCDSTPEHKHISNWFGSHVTLVKDSKRYDEERNVWVCQAKVNLSIYNTSTIRKASFGGITHHYEGTYNGVEYTQYPIINLVWDPDITGLNSQGKEVTGLWIGDGEQIVHNYCYTAPAAPSTTTIEKLDKIIWTHENYKLPENGAASGTRFLSSRKLIPGTYTVGEMSKEDGAFYCKLTITDLNAYVEAFNKLYATEDETYVIDTVNSPASFEYVLKYTGSTTDYKQDGTGWTLDIAKSGMTNAEKLNGRNLWMVHTPHIFGEWTTTKAATCTEDGEEIRKCTHNASDKTRACTKTETRVIPATGHNLTHVAAVAPTCEVAGNIEYWFCSNCGKYFTDEACTKEVTAEETILAPIGHDWKGIGTVAATCTTPEYTTYQCQNDPHHIKQEVSGEALGHDYETVVTAPTCTTGGYTTYTCKRCGENHVDDITQPTGHTWDEGKIVKGADCTSDGVMEYTCTVCGETKQENIGATGHKYEETKHEANCTECGWITHTCSVCGYTYDSDHVAALGHKYEEKVVAPTCTAAGYTEYTCSVCGDRYTDHIVQPTGHNYERVVEDPTCTELGKTWEVCSVCKDKRLVDVTNALGHNFEEEWTIDVPATCEGEGSKSHHCTRCDEKADVTVIPATGHDWDEGKVTTKPTMNNPGVKTYTCQNDPSHTYTEEIAPIVPDLPTLKDVQNIERLIWVVENCRTKVDGTGAAPIQLRDQYNEYIQHQPVPQEGDYTVSELVKGTGLNGVAYRCTITFTEEAIERYIQEFKDGWDDDWEVYWDTFNRTPSSYTLTLMIEDQSPWVIDKQASGFREYDRFGMGIFMTHTKHSFPGSWTKDKDNGIETRRCTVNDTRSHQFQCHYLQVRPIALTAEKAAQALKDLNVALNVNCLTNKDHSLVPEILPESLTVGKLVSTGENAYTCDITVDCSKYLAKCHALGDTQPETVTVTLAWTTNEARNGGSWSTETKAIEINMKEIDHTWGKWEITKAATCEEEGEKTRTCTVCGVTETAKIEATGHDWDEGKITTAATCEEDGVKTYTCNNDDTHTKTEVVKAIGHDWDEGKITTAATCTKEGVKTFTCGNDASHTKTETVPAAGHKASDWKYNDSKHWQECTVCGETIEGSKAPHVDSNGDHKCDTCGKKLTKENYDVAAKTGDSAPVAIVMTVLLISAAGICIICLYYDRKKRTSCQ